jgi:transposase-like protein
MEIITGVERRRRWRLEEKLRIVAEVEEPGSSFAAVARRHEVSRGLLWNWRQQVRRGDLVPEPMPVFVPVQIAPDPPPMPPSPSPALMPVQVKDTRVEITLPDGTCVRVGADVGLASLRRIMTAVRA